MPRRWTKLFMIVFYIGMLAYMHQIVGYVRDRHLISLADEVSRTREENKITTTSSPKFYHTEDTDNKTAAPTITTDITTEKLHTLSNTVCTQQQRLSHINDVCMKRFGHKPNPDFVDNMTDTQVKRLAQEFYVSDSLRLLGCLSWKTGTSTWSWLLLNNSLPQPLGHVKPADWDKLWAEARKKKTAGKLADYTVPEIRERFKTYFKFTTVRHPMDRLVSAYNNKLGTDSSHKKRLSPKIKSFLKITDKRDVTFEQFLQYVSSGGMDLYGDDGGHWHSLLGRCQPCTVHYDYIVRTETHEHDAHYLVNHHMLGRGQHTKANSWRQQPLDGELDHYGRQIQEYQPIADDLYEDIVKKYRTDMDVYGYGMERKGGVVITKCVAGKNGQEDCC